MLFPEEGVLDPKQAKTTNIPLGEGREGHLRAGASETFPRAGGVWDVMSVSSGVSLLGLDLCSVTY